MKEAKFQSVAQSVLSSLATHGLGSISHSRISRLAKVSRPWIYKYVGKTKKDLIQFAVKSFGEGLVAIGGTPPQKDPEKLLEHFFANTWLIFEYAQKHPEVIQLYYRFMGTLNPIGEKIAEFEAQAMNAQAQAISTSFGISKAEALLVSEMMITFRMGICFRFAHAKLSSRADRKKLEVAMDRFFKHTSAVLQKKRALLG
ncbi:MAG: hypothetical protein JNL01_02025 [Bdellovibrionales bacterium]|nr:hypothetical protein [Bdellovibrionales bacterium]